MQRGFDAAEGELGLVKRAALQIDDCDEAA